MKGLEPLLRKKSAPKTDASTNFATSINRQCEVWTHDAFKRLHFQNAHYKPLSQLSNSKKTFTKTFCKIQPKVRIWKSN